MKSHRRRSFDVLFAGLPAHVQELARRAYQTWRDDPWHASLHFKSVGGPVWSVRVGRRYRVLGIREGDTVVWYWIGPHGTYDKKI